MTNCQLRTDDDDNGDGDDGGEECLVFRDTLRIEFNVKAFTINIASMMNSMA